MERLTEQQIAAMTPEEPAGYLGVSFETALDIWAGATGNYRDREVEPEPDPA